YLSGYDGMDEGKRHINFLKKEANLRTSPFLVCYEKSDTFLREPLLTSEKDVEDSVKFTSQVNQIVLNGNK
ncbi:hypothetical protein CGH26_27005, partial [Vibrio parahaemolyticus]